MKSDFAEIAARCYAAYRADPRRSTTAEDGDKALLDAAYLTALLGRSDLAEYVAALHDSLALQIAAAPSLKMPGEPPPRQPRATLPPQRVTVGG